MLHIPTSNIAIQYRTQIIRRIPIRDIADHYCQSLVFVIPYTLYINFFYH